MSVTIEWLEKRIALAKYIDDESMIPVYQLALQSLRAQAQREADQQLVTAEWCEAAGMVRMDYYGGHCFDAESDLGNPYLEVDFENNQPPALFVYEMHGSDSAKIKSNPTIADVKGLAEILGIELQPSPSGAAQGE